MKKFNFNIKSLIKECLDEMMNEDKFKGISIVDYETGAGYRILTIAKGATFEDAIQNFEKRHPMDSNSVVQYVNAETGETTKGPKFDTTEQEVISGGAHDIKRFLKPGVKQQNPQEPMQYEPRDRFKLNEVFRKMVKEAINEAKKSRKEKSKPIPKDSQQQDRAYQGDRRNAGKVDKSNTTDAKVEELTKIAQKAYKGSTVFFDDHKDIRVEAKNKLSIRINEKYENNFDVEAFKNMTDRIYAIGLTYDQLKDFIKVNLEKIEDLDYVGSAHKKVDDNREDKSKKKADGPIKTEPVKQVEVPKKEKEEPTKEDKPDKPMEDADAEDVKKQSDFKAAKPPTAVSDKAGKEYKKPVTKFTDKGKK
jgi:hypothetical protein